jgi:hypothetical protein
MLGLENWHLRAPYFYPRPGLAMKSNVANSAKLLARMLVLRSETKNGRMLK